MFTVIATKDECYQISNGEKKLLPGSLCNDFKPFIALLPEVNLLSHNNVDLKEVKLNGEKCYAVEIPGEGTTQTYIFSNSTGLKVKEITLTKANDKSTENPIILKDYKSYNNLKFPTIQIFTNFMSAGIEAEFKLVDVQYNTENTTTD